MQEAGEALLAASHAATWIWSAWVALACAVGGALLALDEWRLARPRKTPPDGGVGVPEWTL